MRIHAGRLLTSCYRRIESPATWAIGRIERPWRLLARLLPQGRSATRLFLAILREIFDESAYERFLRHRNVRSTTHAYAEFLRESSQRQARRGRCC